MMPEEPSVPEQQCSMRLGSTPMLVQTSAVSKAPSLGLDLTSPSLADAGRCQDAIKGGSVLGCI